jgi:hypothetical protein
VAEFGSAKAQHPLRSRVGTVVLRDPSAVSFGTRQADLSPIGVEKVVPETRP